MPAVETVLVDRSEHLQNLENEYEELREICDLIEEGADVSLKERRDASVLRLQDNYEMLGTPKHKISGLILAKCQEIGIEISQKTIWRILHPDFSQGTKKNSSKPKPFAESNSVGISIYTRAREAIDWVIKKMEVEPWDESLDPHDRKERDRILPAMLDFFDDVKDGRMLVQTATFGIAMDAIVRAVLSDEYTAYQLRVKDALKRLHADEKKRGIYTLDEISGKQWAKIKRLRVAQIPMRFQPTNSDEAQIRYFTGEKCPQCSRYRVDEIPEGGLIFRYKCLDCHYEYAKKPPRVPLKDQVMIDSSGSTHSLKIRKA